MVVFSQVVVVELDQGLDGFLHRAHLDQSHLVVLPEGETQQTRTISQGVYRVGQPQENRNEKRWVKTKEDENLRIQKIPKISKF